jgi:hypothetical protein
VLHEGDMVHVTGFLYRVRCQKDGDYHLEIGSEAVRGSPCLIVEVPDPGQVSDPELKDDVVRVRQTVEQLDPAPSPCSIVAHYLQQLDSVDRQEPSLASAATLLTKQPIGRGRYIPPAP